MGFGVFPPYSAFVFHARRGTIGTMNRDLATPPPHPGWRVVVDLGGTWVRVSASGPTRRAFRGPSPGAADLPRLLDRLWRRWGLTRGRIAALGVASRGVWTGGERRALARRLRRFARRGGVISGVEAAPPRAPRRAGV